MAPASGSLQRTHPKSIEDRLHALWDRANVPQWHRKLYCARYCLPGIRAEVLQREVAALVAGDALVLQAMHAVESREAVLQHLAQLRENHTDPELSRSRGTLWKALLRQMLILRSTSVDAVEAIYAWRRSVAPVPGQEAQGCACSVAGPGGRGATWPAGPHGEDYLLYLASDESVVRAFENIFQLAPPGDPFLLGPIPATSGGASRSKRRLPAVEAVQEKRLEAARMHLLQDEVELGIFGGQASRSTDLKAEVISVDEGHAANSDSKDAGASIGSFGHRNDSSFRDPGSWDDDVLARAAPAHLLPFLRPPGSPCPSRGRRAARHLLAVRARHKRSHGCMLFESQRRVAIIFKYPDLEVAKRATELQNTWEVATCVRKSPTLSSTADSERSYEFLDVVERRSTFIDVGERRSTLRPRSSQSQVEAQLTGEQCENVPSILDPARIHAVFRRFQVDSFIHFDDMCDALRRLGFAHPVREWIDEAFVQLTSYTTLTASEFISFCGLYEEKLRAACLEKFEKYDTDSSHRLEPGEFAKLLQDMDIEPMPHVLEEIINEVDKDCNGDLDFEEFIEVMRLRQEREGFTKGEYVRFMEVFDLIDRDNLGEMDAQELLKVFNFLGYHCSPEDMAGVTTEVDFDGSGCIGRHEFLVCMRKLRERELRALKAAVLNREADMGSMLNSGELQMFMYSVGYFPDEEVVKELLEDIGAGLASRVKRDTSFYLGLLWQFLVLFRSREGLCRADLQEIEIAFARYAVGAEVAVAQLPKIIRYMGYALTYEEYQQLVKQVDINQSGALCIFELRKLVRICAEQRTQTIYDAFVKHKDDKAVVVPQIVVGEVLHRLGCIQHDALSVPIPQDDAISYMHGGFSLKAFMRLARGCFGELAHEVRKNSGYSWREIEVLRAQFRIFDTDQSGDIQNSELVELVKTVFPDMAADAKLRPHLLEILQEADADGNGSLDFDDFLRLMRTVFELRYRCQLDKEQQAVTDTGFNPHEVHEFRNIFLGHAGHDKVLSLDEFMEVIGGICPLGSQNCNQLIGIWHEVLLAHRSKIELEGLEQSEAYIHKCDIDFPEFLTLMKQIITVNLGGILQRTQGHAKSKEKFSQPTAAVAAAPQGMVHDLRPSIMYMLGGVTKLMYGGNLELPGSLFPKEACSDGLFPIAEEESELA